MTRALSPSRTETLYAYRRARLDAEAAGRAVDRAREAMDRAREAMDRAREAMDRAREAMDRAAATIRPSNRVVFQVARDRYYAAVTASEIAGDVLRRYADELNIYLPPEPDY